MAESVPSNRLGTERGLTLGKFLPPHAGHQYLIDFARHFVRDLTILVCSTPSDPIPGTHRYHWMRNLFPDCRVVHVTDDVPQTPEESRDFWPIWTELIKRETPRGFEVFFSSERYGDEVARRFAARHVPVDPARELFPVSGTAVRENPFGNWRFIPRPVRPHFVKRVCLFGPESTGKSTLARLLAEHFQTNHVPEFARPWLDWTESPCTPEDLEVIVAGQSAAEDAAALDANKLLFCDTDPLLTNVWSEMLFGDRPEWLRLAAHRRRYDLYLLLGVDVPWVDDRTRYFPESDTRSKFYQRCVAILEGESRHYVPIEGTWAERLERAITAVNAHFGISGQTSRRAGRP